MGDNPENPNPQQVIVVQPQAFFPTLRTFDPSEGSFSGWIQRFEEFCTINNIADEPEVGVGQPVPNNTKRGLFLGYIGPRAYDIVKSMCLPGLPNEKTIPQITAILLQRYEPTGLRPVNRLDFTSRFQRDGESVEEYVAAIQELAAKGGYGAQLNEALCDQMVRGVRSERAREKLLAEGNNLNYARAVQIATSDETVRRTAKALSQSVNVSRVAANHRGSRGGRPFSKRQPSQAGSTPRGGWQHRGRGRGRGAQQVNTQPTQPRYGPCKRCDRRHDYKKCPAFNWVCYACKQTGHIAKKCPNVGQNHVSTHQSQSHQQVPTSTLNVQSVQSIDQEVDNLITLMGNDFGQ